MRKIVRATAWGLKGVLAVVALGALFLWPWSYRHPAGVEGERWTTGAERVDWLDVAGGWDAGRLGIREGVARYTPSAAQPAWEDLASLPPGWSWNWGPGTAGWDVRLEDSSWGPFGWQFVEDVHTGQTTIWRSASAPLWLLASLAGAWPLGSVAGLIRRRRRASRRAARNCCRRCGYDLRATPAAAGVLFGRCPARGPAPARPGKA